MLGDERALLTIRICNLSIDGHIRWTLRSSEPIALCSHARHKEYRADEYPDLWFRVMENDATHGGRVTLAIGVGDTTLQFLGPGQGCGASWEMDFLYDHLREKDAEQEFAEGESAVAGLRAFLDDVAVEVQ